MKTLKEWIEQRARALNQMEDMQKRAASEGRAMNDDENKQWDSWDKEFEEANAEIGKLDQLEKRRDTIDREERGGDARKVTDQVKEITYEEAFKRYCQRGANRLTSDELNALNKGETRGTNTLLAGDT